jgi:transketolase
MAALRRGLPDAAADAVCLPLCCLFARHLRFDSADPAWPDRDRLVVAAGLAPLGALLAELAGLSADAFDSAGPAFGIGTGLALAERLLAARFGRSLVDHRSWVVASGDDLASGPVQEAAWLAGAWRLGRLTAIAGVAAADAPGLAGFVAASWSVRRVEAGDGAAIAGAISAAMRSQRPSLIACMRPERGRPWTAGVSAEARLGANLAELADSLEGWRATGRRCAGVRRAWLKRLARHGSRQDFENAALGKLPHGWHTAFFDPGPLLPAGETTVSTNRTVRGAMLRLAAAVPDVAAIPADADTRQAPPPNGTRLGCDVSAGMVHGISTVAAGLALHGGTVPVAKFALAEAESVRAGLRVAAAAGRRLLNVLVEPAAPCPSGGHRAGLRAMQNLCTFRPADASEALECAELAFRRTDGPTALLVSDAAVKLLWDRPSCTRCAKGAYVLAEAQGARAATLVAGGPEVHLAIAAQAVLAAAGTPVAVVSLPSWTMFGRQDLAWQEAVLGEAPRIGLEAGSGFGWERWLGQHGLFIGPDQMGNAGWDAARPGPAAHRVAELVLRHLGRNQPV